MVDAWADPDDVALWTKQQVTEEDCLRAQDIIELFAGTTFLAYDNISPGNMRKLNRAVAYQAGWMVEHPDLYTHTDADSVSSDGASVTKAHENADLLAPFARRWLARLTWRNAPLRVRRRYGQSDYSNSGSLDSAAADDSRIWTPL